MKTPAILTAVISFGAGIAFCLYGVHKEKQATTAEAYEVYIDPAFGPKGNAEVHAALNAWQTATKDTDYPLFFTTHSEMRMCGQKQFTCDDGMFTIHPETEKIITLMYDKPFAVAVGLADYHNNIFVAKELTPSKSRRVLMHEVGHILKLDHGANNTIMASDISYMSDCVTEADIEQYKAVKE